jgi:hypothetical protein
MGRSRPRYKLSAGGRPRGIGDYAELIVARILHRNLTPLQGCVVQIAAVGVFAFAFWGLYASGLIVRILEPIAQWYASQLHFGLTPTSSPVP